MFLLNNIPRRVELRRRIREHFINSDLFLRYATGVSDAIEPEGVHVYDNITTALHNGLYHCIVVTDRLGFLFGRYYIQQNVDYIMRMLIRHGIMVFADLVLQRLTIRSRHQRLQNGNQLLHTGFRELSQFSQSLWGFFFDAFERNFRMY